MRQFHSRMNLSILFLVSFFFLSTNLAGQRLSFEPINTYDGLSQNNVLSAHKCSDGYLWFATYDGLNRYDGYDFKVYRHSTENKNSISGNLLTIVSEDKKKNIWVSTFNDGLSRLNKNNRTIYYL